MKIAIKEVLSVWDFEGFQLCNSPAGLPLLPETLNTPMLSCVLSVAHFMNQFPKHYKWF